MIAALLLAATIAVSESAALAEAAVELANDWKIDEAERTARRALELAIVCDDARGLSRALEASSIVERSRGRASEALALAEEALLVADDGDGQARAHNAIGRVYAEMLGHPAAARAEFTSALAIPVSDRRIPVRAWLNLGNLALEERDLHAARTAFLEASRIAAGAGDLRGRIAAEHNLGLLHLFQNAPARALESLRRALGLDRANGSAQQARILLSIAEAHRALGANDAAAGALSRARRDAKASGDAATLAMIVLREGDLQAARGDFEAAARSFDESAMLDPEEILVDVYRARMMLAAGRWRDAADLASHAATVAETREQPDTVALASTTAGTALRRLGDTAAARRAFDTAIAAVERQRLRTAGGLEARLRFFERELSPYQAMVDLLVSAGDAPGALSYARRGRARIVGDVRDPRPRGPRDDEAFVEYSVSGERVYAFIVTSAGTRAVKLAESRSRIAALAVAFARDLAVRNLGFRPAARLLHQTLIAPLGIDSYARLVIVPDGDLWLVPFQALIGSDDRYLVEHTTISYAPSGALIDAPGRRAPRRVLLASNLPDGAREVHTIGSVWSTPPAVLDGATEETFCEQARRFEIVHVAAHGVYDDADPLQSYLALDASPRTDGRLTAADVLRLKLTARLVVLSACDMAAGQPAAGEGLVGMSWAFMVAGAESVIAATWEVDSEPTTQLMVDMHRSLAAGATPAEALRGAQLACLRSSRWSHPFYWAAFVDVGNGS